MLKATFVAPTLRLPKAKHTHRQLHTFALHDGFDLCTCGAFGSCSKLEDAWPGVVGHVKVTILCNNSVTTMHLAGHAKPAQVIVTASRASVSRHDNRAPSTLETAWP